jgi:hypothetical protein
VVSASPGRSKNSIATVANVTAFFTRNCVITTRFFVFKLYIF